MLQWGVSQSAEVENQLVSYERLLQFAGKRMESEEGEQDKFHANSCPVGWPASGQLEGCNLTLNTLQTLQTLFHPSMISISTSNP
jgi:hypothetical protein